MVRFCRLLPGRVPVYMCTCIPPYTGTTSSARSLAGVLTSVLTGCADISLAGKGWRSGNRSAGARGGRRHVRDQDRGRAQPRGPDRFRADQRHGSRGVRDRRHGRQWAPSSCRHPRRRPQPDGRWVRRGLPLCGLPSSRAATTALRPSSAPAHVCRTWRRAQPPLGAAVGPLGAALGPIRRWMHVCRTWPHAQPPDRRCPHRGWRHSYASRQWNRGARRPAVRRRGSRCMPGGHASGWIHAEAPLDESSSRGSRAQVRGLGCPGGIRWGRRIRVALGPRAGRWCTNTL